MKRYLLLLTVASAAFFGCTPEDKPTQDPAGFDVRLEIPAEIIIEQDAKTMSVMFDRERKKKLAKGFVKLTKI